MFEIERNRLISDYIESYHPSDLELIASAEPNSQRHDLHIDLFKILDYSDKLVFPLLDSPIPFTDSIKQLALGLLEFKNSFGESLDIRLSNPPSCLHKSSISSIGVSDSGKLVSLSGTVIRCGLVKSLAVEKDFICSSCKTAFRATAEISTYFSFELPAQCPSKQKCKYPNFEALEGSEEWLDCKEVKLNDKFSGATGGCMPHSLSLILTGNLVAFCTPGDDITVTGVVVKRWKPLVRNCPCEVQLCLLASSIQVDDAKATHPHSAGSAPLSSDEFSRRNSLVHSFAPQIYGCDSVKLAVLLCVIGGVREEIQGLHLRGHCHILLIGEPGTGKSELLREVCKVSVRGVYTNATGASKAGLTLSAVKEGTDWMLEAGALVLADCGVCCLDDLSLLGKEDLSEIYECMENQTISVAKAGVVCSVNTRSTIVASCRPKKVRFDFGADVEANAGLPAPLLSRFDLVFLMLDYPEEAADEIKAGFILGGASLSSELLSYREIQCYLDKVKELKPGMSSLASDMLLKYFQLLWEKRDSCVTIRQLESLIRLSKAHARLCEREEVNIFDSISVILLMEGTCRSSGILGFDPSKCLFEESLFWEAGKQLFHILDIPLED